jgi:hypothetical protein
MSCGGAEREGQSGVKSAYRINREADTVRNIRRLPERSGRHVDWRKAEEMVLFHTDHYY